MEENEKEILHQLSKPTVSNTHNWKQHGKTLICDSCDTPHGISLPMGHQMTGVDDKGQPIIKKIW